MRCPPKGYVPLTSSILVFVGMGTLWILMQRSGNRSLPPSERHLYFKSFDLIPVSLDGNWTLHDIKRKTNVPKITKFRHLEDYPALPSSFIDQPSDQIDCNASATSNLLIYNRVRKTGSTSVQLILKQLQLINHFTSSSSDDFATHSLTISEEEKFTQSHHFQQPVPHLLDGHFYFVDLPSHGLTIKPVWINFVRDPIDRIASNFYYNRLPKRWFQAARKPPSDYFVKNFDTCVLSHDPECQFQSGQYREQQLTYFCGNSPYCREIGNRQALAVAKFNVERFYLVVGLTSEIELTLKLLSAKLPKFFQNVTSLGDGFKHINHTPYKMPLPGVRRKLISKLTLEMEFYDFVRQRLARQLRDVI